MQQSHKPPRPPHPHALNASSTFPQRGRAYCRDMMRKIATGAVVAGVLGLAGLAVPAEAATATNAQAATAATATTAQTGTTQSARWPCRLQAKKDVRVHRRANKTSPYWVARKGHKFYGYCWTNDRPATNWAEVRGTLNGTHGYVWWADLRVLR